MAKRVYNRDRRARTKRACLLQELLVCQQCGYAMYGTSGGKPEHRLYYYRCQGADGYRWPQGTRCTNRPVRQDYLDQIIWTQIIALLENESLIQSEIDRRREAASKTDPCERLWSRRHNRCASQQSCKVEWWAWKPEQKHIISGGHDEIREARCD